jgi:hypothetical protein
MAAQAPVVLNTRGTVNGATTATVSFDVSGTISAKLPSGRFQYFSKWEERSTGILKAFRQLWQDFRSPGPSAETTQVTYTIAIPTMEQTAPSTATGIQPAPTVAYTHLARIEFILPARGTASERFEVLEHAKDLLTEAVVSQAVRTLEPAN